MPDAGSEIDRAAVFVRHADRRFQVVTNQGHYFKPPAADSTDPVTDVSAQPDGNTPGKVMQVSVQGFSLLPLVPMLFSWKDKPERNALLIRTVEESAMYWKRALTTYVEAKDSTGLNNAFNTVASEILRLAQ